jgi:mersacidin/lichenicidin family type 2 lantibiotic
MKSITIAAWKNRQFRQRLNPEQLARLPANPAGTLELTATEIEAVAGAGLGVEPNSKTVPAPCDPRDCPPPSTRTPYPGALCFPPPIVK